MSRRLRPLIAAALVVPVLAGGCVGSGKVAGRDDLGPLPPGLTVVAETTTGCREGESGFDYRFLVVTGAGDLSREGPLPRALRDNGFYHSIGLPDDLPWIAVGYQHRTVPLRAELGPLDRFLDRPHPHHGPDPASIPAEVRERPDDAVLVALRPTDFLCTTPL